MFNLDKGKGTAVTLGHEAYVVIQVVLTEKFI